MSRYCRVISGAVHFNRPASATEISGPAAAMARAGDAVREAIEKRLDGLLGIHFEGPLLNRARLGAHDGDQVPASPESDKCQSGSPAFADS